jgi:hypothetical protein
MSKVGVKEEVQWEVLDGDIREQIHRLGFTGRS